MVLANGIRSLISEENGFGKISCVELRWGVRFFCDPWPVPRDIT